MAAISLTTCSTCFTGERAATADAGAVAEPGASPQVCTANATASSTTSRPTTSPPMYSFASVCIL